MPSRNESARALARLKLEMPISDDANLLNLQKQVEDFVRDAKRRDPSGPLHAVFSLSEDTGWPQQRNETRLLT